MKDLHLETPFEISVEEFLSLRAPFFDEQPIMKGNKEDNMTYSITLENNEILETFSTDADFVELKSMVESEEGMITYIDVLKEFFHIYDVGRIDVKKGVRNYFSTVFSSEKEIRFINSYLIDKKTKYRIKVRLFSGNFYQLHAFYVEFPRYEQERQKMKETYKELTEDLVKRVLDINEKQKIRVLLNLF